ncbi:KH domain-containing protein HEN4, partial [Linum perenne]
LLFSGEGPNRVSGGGHPSGKATGRDILCCTYSRSSVRLSPMESPSSLSKFRILCPSARTGAVIGKGGATVRHIQSVTGAKIRLLDNPHGHPACDERVILISHVNNPFSSTNNRIPRAVPADEAATTTSATDNSNRSASHPQDGGETDGSSSVSTKGSGGESGDEGWGPVQKALVRVFEKIVKGDSVEELGEEVVVVGRVLVGNDQAACLFGRGGNVLEKIMVESGAQQVRLLPRDQIPPCAAQSDELILITGSYSAVRRALLSFYACLEDISKAEAANPGSTKPSGGHHGPMDFPHRGYGDYHPRGHSPNMGPENYDGRSRRVIEEDVVFKLLCQLDKVGSLIGKGGAVIKTLQNDTGASIKISDVLPDLQERVVIISAREAWELNPDNFNFVQNSEQRRSPAQDGVIRVQTRIAEIGYEHGAPVVARLVVHSQQIGRLLGKGGQIISEMRQATGAHIRIFPKEQVAKHGTPHDEIVQVVGNLQCVQDALYHITGRLREIIFPVKSSFSNNAGPPPYQSSQFSDMPPPQFRPHPSSAGHYPSPAGPYHGGDHPPGPPHHQDHQPGFSYGDERQGHGGPPYEISPRSWNPQQPFSNGNPHGGADAGPGYAVRNGPPNSGAQPPGMPVEMVIPPNFLSHVYGENNSNLNQIIQISGANIAVQDAKTGGGEGVAVISGASDQIHIAQCLIHGFIQTGRAAA